MVDITPKIVQFVIYHASKIQSVSHLSPPADGIIITKKTQTCLWYYHQYGTMSEVLKFFYTKLNFIIMKLRHLIFALVSAGHCVHPYERGHSTTTRMIDRCAGRA